MLRLPRSRKILITSFLIGAFTLGVFAGGQLSTGEARKLIARAGGVNLKTEDVHIRRIDISPGGQSAIVEALVQLAFRFTRRDGAWQVSEIRTGDRQWDDMEMIRAALDAKKAQRTREDLSVVAAAVAKYQRSRGSLPAARDFPALIDALLPDYLPRIIREDGWDRPLILEAKSGRFKLSSLGPDGRAGTEDDIVIDAPD